MIVQQGLAGIAEDAIAEESPLLVYPDFFSKTQADYLYNHCASTLRWTQNSSRGTRMPRLECCYSRSGKSYTYTGIELRSRPLTYILHRAMLAVEVKTGLGFDMVIGNWYLDGNHHIGWHADRDPVMGEDPAIATISLGTTRRFQVRRQSGSKIHTHNLNHGSLNVMPPGMQRGWEHQILRDAAVQGDRISLTFRPAAIP